ncbi:MAG: alkaline phosphatase family protein [Caldilineae bacterium]|nr:alkaline phosphatase family protein [Chloroflexota bacterium]MCB9176147.1 alkaline phosphatase family protein [Caldilineae bacterium]
MPAPTLILFVDALPFDDLGQLPGLNGWAWKARLRPGFGYSINLHPELFCGLDPDRVGFFGEWALDRTGAPGRRYRAVLPLLDRLCRPYLLNRGLQHLLTKRYRPDRIMPNLPLRWLGEFSIHGEKVEDPRFDRPSIFSRHPGLQRVSTAGLSKGARDARVVERAAAAIAAGAEQLYVPLIDLDGIGHAHRRSSEAWQAHLARLDAWIAVLSEGFLARQPEGQVFVLSDHGMADVTGSVELRIEQDIAKAGPGRFLYFSDSTLLRIWVFDPDLGEAIAAYLDDSPVATPIMQPEREAYGIANPAFGDFIAVLDEGLCFKPSTFARNIPAAMHGYHPTVSSQQALLAWRGPAGREPARAAAVDRTLAVFPLLDAALGRAAGDR